MQDNIQIIPRYDVLEHERFVDKLYASIPDFQHISLADRILKIGEVFLGRPYVRGALGEGPDGRFDKNPLFRFDCFDCLTYVNTVLALALADHV